MATRKKYQIDVPAQAQTEQHSDGTWIARLPSFPIQVMGQGETEAEAVTALTDAIVAALPHPEDREGSEAVRNFFLTRGDEVWENPEEAATTTVSIMASMEPELPGLSTFSMQELLNDEEVVGVLFWSEDAPTSISAASWLIEFAKSAPGRMGIGNVDVKRDPDLAVRFEVGELPAVVAFVRGREADRVTVPATAEDVRRMVAPLLPSA